LKDFFQLTSESIFEKKLIENLMADILFKQSSFRAYTDTYNHLYVTSRFKRSLLDRRRLAEVFYTYHISKFFDEHQLPDKLICMHVFKKT